jgi:hypothetical protein
MAKNANELLEGILSTIVRIDQKMSKDKKPPTGAQSLIGGVKGMLTVSGNLMAFGKVKEQTKKSFISFMKDIADIVKKDKGKAFDYFSKGIVQISNALPNLVKSLQELGKLSTRRVDMAISTLKRLYDFMSEMGDGRSARRIERATKLFDKIGTSLDKVAKPIKTISMSFIYLAVGIVAFAGAMLLTSALLKLSSPKDALLFLGFTIISMVLVFGILALAERVVKKGALTLKEMGIGMAALALGIVSFALAIKLVPMILGGEGGGSIMGGLFIMLGIIAAAVLMFTMIGAAAGLIEKGNGVVLMMSLGLIALSAAMIIMATASKYLQGGSLTLGAQKGTEDEKDANKKMVLRGLGTFGLVFLAASAAFVLLGLASTFIIPGIGVAILMAVALIAMSASIVKLVKTAKQLEGEDIATSISTLIGGTLNGFLMGLAPMTGGKTGVRAIGEFMKNSAKIFAGVAVLMSMSVALSMFAWALTAFAELDNMRIITGTDKDGKPIFGEKINVQEVGANMTATLSTFLTGLIESTGELTMSKARALKKLGRALTGRRGVLSALNDFAEILKTFSQFGKDGEIGYVDMVPDGNDEDGNAKFKQVSKKVKITQVATNIANSFGTFVDELVKHTSIFEITGEKGRSMMHLAEVLMGSKALKVFGLSFGKERPGLLEPITKFSEILSQYASYGDGNKIPILNAKGEVVKEVNVETIAKNIVNVLSTFSTTLGAASVNVDTTKAEQNIAKFSDLMTETDKLSKSLDSLGKFNLEIKNLADNIGSLAINLDKLNTEKLNGLLEKTSAASFRPIYTTAEVASAAVTPAAPANSSGMASSSSSSKPENWDRISQMIGEQVGAKVSAALRNGQFVFEFDTSKTGGVYYWQPK